MQLLAAGTSVLCMVQEWLRQQPKGKLSRSGAGCGGEGSEQTCRPPASVTSPGSTATAASSPAAATVMVPVPTCMEQKFTKEIRSSRVASWAFQLAHFRLVEHSFFAMLEESHEFLTTPPRA